MAEDFEWRFQQSLNEHRKKLEALPPDKREQLESQLRENYAAQEKEFREYQNDPDRFSFKGFAALIERQVGDTKRHVDDAHKAHTGDEKLREKIAAKGRQGRDQDRDRER